MARGLDAIINEVLAQLPSNGSKVDAGTLVGALLEVNPQSQAAQILPQLVKGGHIGGAVEKNERGNYVASFWRLVPVTQPEVSARAGIPNAISVGKQ